MRSQGNGGLSFDCSADVRLTRGASPGEPGIRGVVEANARALLECFALGGSALVAGRVEDTKALPEMTMRSGRGSRLGFGPLGGGGVAAGSTGPLLPWRELSKSLEVAAASAGEATDGRWFAADTGRLRPTPSELMPNEPADAEVAGGPMSTASSSPAPGGASSPRGGGDSVGSMDFNEGTTPGTQGSPRHAPDPGHGDVSDSVANTEERGLFTPAEDGSTVHASDEMRGPSSNRIAGFELPFLPQDPPVAPEEERQDPPLTQVSVPEPGVVAFFVVGLAALAVRRRW